MSKRIYPDESDRALDYFMSKFDCRITDSREYNQYVIPRPYHKDFYDYSSFQIETKVVPMKAIHLPVEKLNDLVKQQDYIKYIEERSEHALDTVRMLREDERVRDTNPAVQKAYRNYLTLLELARK